MKRSPINVCVVMCMMQVLILATLWVSRPFESAAVAQGIPDAGAQRDRMIEQLRATNEKLDRLISILAGGDLQVHVSKSDRDSSHR